MTRKESNLDLLIDRLDRLFMELDPSDALVMAMGAIAGTQGYTPLSAILGSYSQGQIEKVRQMAAEGDRVAGGVAAASNAGPWAMIPTVGIWSFIGGAIFPQEAAGVVSTDADKQVVASAIMAKIALGCIGAIEAYVVTRPGTLSGIGEIVKGIGEIMPG